MGSVGVQNVNPHEELKRLEEQIKAATEFAALKPIYFRLAAIIEAFPGDFDVCVTANDVKQHLVARGTLLQQGEISPPAPPAPPPSPPPLPTSLLDTVSPARGCPTRTARDACGVAVAAALLVIRLRWARAASAGTRWDA